MENDAVATDKKSSNKKLLTIFLAALFLGFLLLIYKNKESLNNLIVGNKTQVHKNNSDMSNDLDENDTNSPFSKLIEQNQNNGETYSPYSTEVTNNLEKAMIYDINMRTYGNNSWDKVLEDGDFLIEVVSEGSKKLYKLIYSKYPFIDIENSDSEYLKFNPVIDSPKSLVVIEGSNMEFDFEDSDIEGGFENSILELGDKAIFKCKHENCKDGLLNWVLVIKK